MDAANVDLKAFTDRFYAHETLSHLEPVKETLEWLARETRVWVEVTNLVIPGLNDAEDETRALADFVVTRMGPDVPDHFTAFHPDYKMTDRPRSPALPASATSTRGTSTTATARPPSARGAARASSSATGSRCARRCCGEARAPPAARGSRGDSRTGRSRPRRGCGSRSAFLWRERVPRVRMACSSAGGAG